MKNIVLILILIISTIQLLNAQDTDTTSCSGSLEETENNTVLNIFPNPTEGTFQIVYKSITKCPPVGWGGMLMINIVNSYNKTVYSETILVFEDEYVRTIDLADQEKGIYTIEMTVGNKMKVIREALK